METERLYQKDRYLKEIEAEVLAVREGGLVVDRTVFFPEGGGQPGDAGIVTKLEPEGGGGQEALSLRIADTREEGGEILHVIPEGAEGLQAGDRVRLSLDWERRFENMQRHLGEHILSGAFFRLFRGHNKGFHMGQDLITIDIAFDPDSPYKKVSWDMAMEAELEANRVVMRDEKVRFDLFRTREEAAAMPLRKPLAFDEDISVVTVGDVEDPSDCVACCGTHPDSSGQAGLIKIYKLESNKGMTRIFFDCGERALRRYREEFEVLRALGNKLSAGYEDMLDKYGAKERELTEVKNELYKFRREGLKKEAERIAGEPEVFVRRFQGLTPDDLMGIIKLLPKGYSGSVILSSDDHNTAVLCSEGAFDAGKAVREIALPMGGKGGGSPVMARAMFPDKGALDRFLEAAEKAYRGEDLQL